MGRTVLLRHALPDGSVHWDWLIQPPDSPPGDPVPTFRLEHSFVDSEVEGGIRAERIADHRAMYLDYEGPVSHDRGTVRRVWEAWVLSLEVSEDLLMCSTSAGCGVCRILAERAGARPKSGEGAGYGSDGGWLIRVEHHRR